MGTRATLGVVAAVALPLACGAFGSAVDEPLVRDAGDAPTADGAALADGDANAPGVMDSGTFDAARVVSNSGLVLVCDDFRRPDDVLDAGDASPFWSKGQGQQYLGVVPGLFGAVAPSSTTAYLESHVRSREDVVAYRVEVKVVKRQEWATFDGSGRVVDIDASIGVDDAEYGGLEIAGGKWRMLHRSFDKDGVPDDAEILLPAVEYGRVYVIDVEQRFAPNDGYVRVAFDGKVAAEGSGLATGTSAPAKEYRVRLGWQNDKTTPIVELQFTKFCASGARKS